MTTTADTKDTAALAKAVRAQHKTAADAEIAQLPAAVDAALALRDAADLDAEVLVGEIVPNLDELAGEANREHAAGLAAEGRALDHYLRAGYALRAAKAEIAHGEWLLWLAINCPEISERRAQQYVDAVRYLDANPNHRSYLTTFTAVRKAAAAERAAALAETRAQEATAPPGDEPNGHALSPDEQAAHECGLALTGARMAAEDFMESVTGIEGDHHGVTVDGLRLDPRRLIGEAEAVLALLKPAIDLLNARIADAREAIDR